MIFWLVDHVTQVCSPTSNSNDLHGLSVQSFLTIGVLQCFLAGSSWLDLHGAVLFCRTAGSCPYCGRLMWNQDAKEKSLGRAVRGRTSILTLFPSAAYDGSERRP